MKVVVLGTGDLTKIPRHTKLKAEELRKLIVDIGRYLAEKGHDLIIIPDRGVPLEVAKIYKENKGKRLFGIVPVNDKEFGIEYIGANLSLLDEKIPVDHWYDADGKIAASGAVTIIIGMSPGIVREITVMKYHYKYLHSKTKLIWFRNTIDQELPKSIMEEIPMTYVNSFEELRKLL